MDKSNHIRNYMKVGIVGSRNFNDIVLFEMSLGFIAPYITVIISGGAKGADSMTKDYAKKHSIEYIEYLPDWNKYGKAAGPIRNEDIVKNSDIIVAFWDGKSRGTKSTIDIAQKMKKPTVIIYF